MSRYPIYILGRMNIEKKFQSILSFINFYWPNFYGRENRRLILKDCALTSKKWQTTKKSIAIKLLKV